MTARLIHQWRDQLADYQPFKQRYYNAADCWTLGQRRSFIRSTLVSLNGQAGYACRIEDGEQLRRYFDALYGIPADPDDSTLHKYDYLDDVLNLPEPQPKKARSAMDKNLAALLRSDARTVHVKLPSDSTSDNRTRSQRTFTYVTHLPLEVGDSVVVQAAGQIKIGIVQVVDAEAKIEPGCETEYFWVIDKVDMAAYEANRKRNDDIVAEAAVIVRENLRKSFAAQVLGAASEAQRTKLLELTGNVVS